MWKMHKCTAPCTARARERLSDVFNASNALKVVYVLKRSGRKRDKDTKTA